MKARSVWMPLAAALLLVAGNTAMGHGEDMQWLFRFRGSGPVENDEWETAAGVEFQARFWGGNVGIAFAGGVATWDAVSEFVEDFDADSYYSSSIEGSATLVPVGVSLLTRGHIGPNLSLVLEGGARYVFVDSSIDSAAYLEDGNGVVFSDDRIDIENAWLGIAGVSLEADMSEAVSFHAGLEYQFDLTRPRETYLGEDIGETSLSAVSAVLGVAIRF